MAKAFDISKFAESLNPVSDSDTGREQITYISVDQLVSDDKNFYQITGIEDLASNIQLIGLQQPIRVRKLDDGTYRIVSGHRRCAALRSLVADGHDEFNTVPCIIETESCSPAMQELRLIYANASTRDLTSAEQMQQAERVEELLYELKNEGVKFPGRMRDQVAQACKVTGTKLAELKVIRDKLKDPFSGQFKRNEINESAAYNLARLPENVQDDLASIIGTKKISGCAAENIRDKYHDYYDFSANHDCPEKNGPCGNVLGFLKKTSKSEYSWEYCRGGCCLKCDSRYHCSGACAEAKAKIKSDAEVEKETKKKEDEKRLETQKIMRQSNIDIAQRLLRAADAAGLSDSNPLTLQSYCLHGTPNVSKLRTYACGDTDNDYFYSMDSFTPTNKADICKLAEELHCSTDYIMGLTDDLSSAKVEANAWNSLDSAHWPDINSFVLLRGETNLDGIIYQAAVCVGASDSRYPFEDANDRFELGYADIKNFDSWKLIDRGDAK